MAYLPKSLYTSDFPQLEVLNLASVTAGTANDLAGSFIAAIPDLGHANLPKGLNEGVQGNKKPNRMALRMASIVAQAASLGNTTHSCDYRLNVYRNTLGVGVYQGPLAYYPMSVATTIGTAITSSNINSFVQVTPAAMTGIVPGMALLIDSGTSTAELVYVTATTSTKFTAYFTQLHTTAATVKTALTPYLATEMVPCDALLAATTSTNAVSATGAAYVGLTSAYGVHVGDYLLCDTSTPQETVQVTALYAINTTSGTAVGSAGSTVITPTSMAGIFVGTPLVCDTGASGETVVVTAVGSTTFTATFANTHSSGFRIQADVMQATFANTHTSGFTIAPVNTSGITNVPVLANGTPFELRAGDVLTLSRVSSDLTGLVTPAMSVQIDWEPSARYRQ